MAAGENEQLKAAGRPEHDSKMLSLNDPDWAFAVTVTFVEFPL
jgi:hypothetical protein